MSSILQQNVVLVLNKAWQAINIRTPEEVFPQLATGAATALDIDGQQKIRPVTWEEWIVSGMGAAFYAGGLGLG